MRFNATIFHTQNLGKIRDFYEGILDLPTGTFVKNGVTTPDFSEVYVNYHLEGGLLCFEEDATRTELATVVINIDNLPNLQLRLEQNGIKVKGDSKAYLKVKDPDGRTLILEPKI